MLAEFRGDGANGPISGASVLPNTSETGIDKLAIQYQANGPSATVEFYSLPLEGEWMGVEDVAQDMFSIYPNPVMNTLFIQAKSPVQAVLIYDLNGRLQVQKMLNSSKEGIDVSQLNTGIYFVKLQLQNGKTKTTKLIKR